MGMELNPNTFIVHCCYYKVADSLYLDTVQLQSCVALRVSFLSASSIPMNMINPIFVITPLFYQNLFYSFSNMLNLYGFWNYSISIILYKILIYKYFLSQSCYFRKKKKFLVPISHGVAIFFYFSLWKEVN